MSDPAASIAALEEALSSGELTVEVEGKRTTYRSTEELKGAISYFRARQTEAQAAAGRVYASTLAQFGSD